MAEENYAVFSLRSKVNFLKDKIEELEEESFREIWGGLVTDNFKNKTQQRIKVLEDAMEVLRQQPTETSDYVYLVDINYCDNHEIEVFTYEGAVKWLRDNDYELDEYVTTEELMGMCFYKYVGLEYVTAQIIEKKINK